MFPVIAIDTDHLNTKIISLEPFSLPASPCFLHAHHLANPRYFPPAFRENESKDYFAGFFLSLCCLFQFVHIIIFSLT